MCYHNEAIETIERNGFKLEIFPDDSPDSPENWGWPVKVIDTHINLESEDKRVILEEIGNVWFSQIPTQERGWRYVIAYKSEWIKAMKQGKEKAEYHGWDTTRKGMQATVDAFATVMGQYYDGDIYGYSITTPNGDNGDSLWGIYGLEEAITLGKEAMGKAIETEQDAIAFEKSGMAL